MPRPLVVPSDLTLCMNKGSESKICIVLERERRRVVNLGSIVWSRLAMQIIFLLGGKPRGNEVLKKVTQRHTHVSYRDRNLMKGKVGTVLTWIHYKTFIPILTSIDTKRYNYLWKVYHLISQRHCDFSQSNKLKNNVVATYDCHYKFSVRGCWHSSLSIIESSTGKSCQSLITVFCVK